MAGHNAIAKPLAVMRAIAYSGYFLELQHAIPGHVAALTFHGRWLKTNADKSNAPIRQAKRYRPLLG